MMDVKLKTTKMEINELRIGNNVFFDGKVQEISSIHSDNTIRLKENKDSKCHGCYNVNRIKPIPLTEEVLLSCGFEITDYRIELHPIQLIELVENKGYLFEFHLTRDSKQGNEYFTVIKYLHQLQNLYYSLCDEELTYNHS